MLQSIKTPTSSKSDHSINWHTSSDQVYQVPGETNTHHTKMIYEYISVYQRHFLKGNGKIFHRVIG